jgi:hypothetical protein
MPKYIVSAGIGMEVDADTPDAAYEQAKSRFFGEIQSYKTDELNIEILEELEEEYYA